MYKCKNCSGIHIYHMELRTDYNNFRDIEPMNDDIPDITNDDLPYRLDAYYCHDCQSITDVTDDEERTQKDE